MTNFNVNTGLTVRLRSVFSETTVPKLSVEAQDLALGRVGFSQSDSPDSVDSDLAPGSGQG